MPKDTYVGLRQFELGVYDAIAHFNVGNSATIRIYKELGMKPGDFTIAGCSVDNVERVKNSKRQSSMKEKNIRRLRRGKRKQKKDSAEEKEGKTYCAGQFSV